jgi:Asp-tRNA(Asn)/Glu-tRNA(Gln) amidotransferase A subunit family amidase
LTNELTRLSACKIRDLIAKKEVSALEVVDHFLGRIEELNPRLRAFAHVDAAGAREQARHADEAVLSGSELGPLHGVPVSVKEHISVRGLPLITLPRLGNGGSRRARVDAIAVERLRNAGAIIVGLNTMMGTAGGGAPRPEGRGVFVRFNWDAEARNPWDTSKVPGWSSSGGAAATAAGLVPVAIGSDGGGSTRLPAAYSGVVGVHPTRGLIPSVNYEHPTFDLTSSVGPLARDVRDAAVVTQALAGPDGRDYICIQAETPDFLTSLEAGVDGLRFAWTDDFGYASLYAAAESPRVIAHVRAAAFGLQALGAQVETTAEVWEDPKRGGGPAEGEPFVYQIAVAPSQAALPGHSPQAYQDAAEERARNWARFRHLFGKYDLLLSVTSQQVAPSVEDWDTAWTSGGHRYPHGTFAPTYVSHTVLFNLLGFPAVSVPCGFIDGLPVGLQIVGAPGREDVILRAASAFQNLFPPNDRPRTS